MKPSTRDDQLDENLCLERPELERYLAGLADEDLSERIETHLATCSRCEQTIVELEQRTPELIQSLRRKTDETTLSDSVVMKAIEAAKQESFSHDDISAGPSVLPALPMELGPYDLIEPIGRGGMGLVYLAKHRKLNKRFAVKLLPTQFVDRETHDRFEREIAAAGRLHHPSIVLATDAGQAQGLQYLVMEYVAGLDLGRIARARKELSIADACEIGRQIALGLSVAHAAGMVHRDIKPSNVMLDETGTVKLLDFGLVMLDRWDGVSSELTTIGQFLGTLDYMAPEQAERCGAVDYRADLYSLGATLFRLLTGRAPLAASPNQSPLDKLRLLANHQPPSLKTLRPDAPEGLVELVDELLASRAGNRPAGAAQVSERLAPFCAEADLIKLLDEARQVNDDVGLPITNPPMPASIFLPTNRSAERDRNGRRVSAWLAAALVPLLAWAGYQLVLETSKGQLIIDSEVADVEVVINRDGRPIQDLRIQTGSTATRLAADQYEITIKSPADGLSIDNDKFVLKNGNTIIARITKSVAQASSPHEANAVFGVTTLLGKTSIASTGPKPDTTSEPVYEGQPFSVWFNRMKTERSEEEKKSICKAIQALRSKKNDIALNEYLLNEFRDSQGSLGVYWPLILDDPAEILLSMIQVMDQDPRQYEQTLKFLMYQALSNPHRYLDFEPVWDWVRSKLKGEKEASEVFVRCLVDQFAGRNSPRQLILSGEIQNVLRSLSDSELLSPDDEAHSAKKYKPVSLFIEFLETEPRFRLVVFPLIEPQHSAKFPPELLDRLYAVAKIALTEDKTDAATLAASYGILRSLHARGRIDENAFIEGLDLHLVKLVDIGLLSPVRFPLPNPSSKAADRAREGIRTVIFTIAQESKLLLPVMLIDAEKTKLGNLPRRGLEAIVLATKQKHDAYTAFLEAIDPAKEPRVVSFSWPSLDFGDGTLAPEQQLEWKHFFLHRWANELLGTSLPPPTLAEKKFYRDDFPHDADRRWVDFIKSKMLKADSDGDNRLSSQEWLKFETSSVPLSTADENNDGFVTPGEYYLYKRGPRPPANGPTLYKGKTLDEWLERIPLEIDDQAWMEAFVAVDNLADAEQKQALLDDVYRLGLSKGQFTSAEFGSKLVKWTTPEILGKKLLASFESASNEELVNITKQLSWAVTSLDFPMEFWDPVWKRLDLVLFDSEVPHLELRNEMERFCKELVPIAKSSPNPVSPVKLLDQALHILNGYPRFGRKFLLRPLSEKVGSKITTVTEYQVSVRKWLEANVETLYEHKLAALDDANLELYERVAILDIFDDSEIKRSNYAAVQAADELLVSACEDTRQLGHVIVPSRSPRSIGRENLREQAIKSGSRESPSSVARLQSDHVGNILLYTLARVPKKDRPQGGLDAIIGATKQKHDEIRNEALEKLGVQDLFASSFTHGDAQSLGKTMVRDPRAIKDRRTAFVSDELEPYFNFYFWHRWANELRGTPTADSIKTEN